MQVSNQDMVIRQYAQTAQKTKAAEGTAATEAVQSEKQAAAQKNQTPDKDRVELSSDTKVTSKMSDSERASLVNSLKADLDNQMNRFTNMMVQTFQKQGITAAAGSDEFWRTIASGNFTVDAKTKAEAQAAISEDGYWGVSQTSQRIFDFAAAVAGDDVEKMKEMQAAVEKGFQQAGQAWGGDLPSICGDTHTAVGKLFDDYYASHQ
ncbi:MAG: hypothetical protein HFI30_00440 [Lachnospiraceae bacterium]|jgi:hypothetical protein|nr:hypothetical protein [Lachnospiraceae bacterium]